MKLNKRYLPILIVAGLVALCVLFALVAAGLAAAKGYGITVGKLYFDDTGAYLVDGGDKAMLVSDQSREGDLFENHVSGDRIVLIHGAVDTSYPARAGGYYTLRIARGDGSYKPDDSVLGRETPTDGDFVPELPVAIDFKAKYIRTDGYHSDVEYPIVAVIGSEDELTAHYDKYKDEYSLGRRDPLGSEESLGFAGACEEYGEDFFEENLLILIILEEGSGSVRHRVESVEYYKENGTVTLNVLRLVPEVGTDDMAQWHIIIEVEKLPGVGSEEDVTALIDGVDPKTAPERVDEYGYYLHISLDMPYGWDYEVVRMTDSRDYGIYFWPEEGPEGRIGLFFREHFGVCGTDLKVEEITLGGYAAQKGTYGSSLLWDYIYFVGLPGDYVAINEGDGAWWSRYGREAMAILEGARLAEGYITRDQAVEIAKSVLDGDYEIAEARFDDELGIWELRFESTDPEKEPVSLRMTYEGKLLNDEVEWGLDGAKLMLIRRENLYSGGEGHIIHPFWIEIKEDD